MVVQADSTLNAIRTKVRRLTASSGESALTTDAIDQYINTFYNNDFAYAIKLDQMRSVYTFYTVPYISTYPLDVNYNMGVRAPIYFEGVQGFFYKDRADFYNLWPRWPTQLQPATGDGVTSSFSFTIPGPFLRNNVTIGSLDTSGNGIRIADDGNGNLYLQTPNVRTSVPVITSTAPGMYNENTGNPGQDIQTLVGTVNYVTGSIIFNIPNNIPAAGTPINVFVSQYQRGRPYSLLFWNNTFEVRPVPDNVYKVEVETYMTPVQFLEANNSPILNQWWQYIAIGAAIKVLEDRQDMDGLQNLSVLFDRQEALVLERQGVEEIGQRNKTIFSGAQQTLGWNNGWMQGWYG